MDEHVEEEREVSFHSADLGLMQRAAHVVHDLLFCILSSCLLSRKVELLALWLGRLLAVAN